MAPCKPCPTSIWARGQAPKASGDSLYVSLDGELVENDPLETLTGFDTSQEDWQWANTEQTSDGSLRAASLPIAAHGLYTLTLNLREDGLILDRLFLTIRGLQL